MFNNNLMRNNQTAPSLEYILDRTRICPNCGREHYVNNRARLFCTKKCYDNYYNDYLRTKSTTYGHFNIGGKIIDLSPEQYSVENRSLEESEKNTQRAKNLRILNSLIVDPNEGTLHKMEDLELVGYSFNVYDSRMHFENEITGKNSHYLKIDCFEIFLFSATQVLIFNTNNLKSKP